jgi:MFS family permease
VPADTGAWRTNRLGVGRCMGWLDQRPVGESVAGSNRRGGAGRSHFERAVRELLFFVLFYLYLAWVIEPHLLFHGSDRITDFPSFYTTWSFLASHLSRPGGPVEYLSAFLSQLFYFSWLGALVITLQAWAFGLVAMYLLGRTGLRRLPVLAYVPALFLLVLYGRYTWFFSTTMALLCALALASGYLHLAGGRTLAVSATIFVSLSLVCYYAAGPAVLLFALTCVIPELRQPGRRRLAVAYVLIAAGLPYLLGVKVLGLSSINAYTDLLPVSWRLLYFAARRRGVETVHVLYLLAPVMMGVGGIISALWARHRRGKPARDGRAPKSPHNGWWKTLPWRWLAQTIGLIAVGVAVAWGSFDKAQKTHFAVDYYAYHQRWPEVLAAACAGRADPFVLHAVNRALYHTGQLGESMFAWPQDPTWLCLADPRYPWAYWPNWAVHLELGSINHAEHALTECLTAMGDRPMILQQLARVNMVKGNIGTARIYLWVLSTTLFQRNWARHYLDLLERDPNLATDAEVQDLRHIALEKDYPLLDLSGEDMLLCLLEKNSKNRMAFEYLMASYLLNRELTRFVKRLEELPGRGYRTLPRHYEEAVLVYSATIRTTVQLRGYAPRDQMQAQMEHFVGVLRRHGGDRQAARAELARDYGDSYAFYNLYGPREKIK